MYTYSVVVLREKDMRFSVVVPALPGCATWGETLPEALRMAEEAILAYIDGLEALGQPIPGDADMVCFEMGDAAETSVFRVTATEAAAA